MDAVVLEEAGQMVVTVHRRLARLAICSGSMWFSGDTTSPALTSQIALTESSGSFLWLIGTKSDMINLRPLVSRVFVLFHV